MISAIKNIIENQMGMTFNYGNPSQINYYLHNTDYSQSVDNITAFCYLLTDANYENGKTRATIAVFFSKLMDFDFDASQAIAVQKDCEDKAKEFLNIVAQGNILRYSDARFQYGYNDFAENVGWCAVRAVFEVMTPDCVPWKQMKALIPLITEGNTTTPSYDAEHKLLGVHIFTNSDTPNIPVIYIENVATEPLSTSASILNEDAFCDISQQYPEYWGHLFYTVICNLDELPVTISAKVGNVDTNSLLFE